MTGAQMWFYRQELRRKKSVLEMDAERVRHQISRFRRAEAKRTVVLLKRDLE